MRRFVVGATVSMAVLFAGIVSAQNKIASTEDYSKVMKPTAQAFIAANKAIGSGAFADAKKEVAQARQGFTTILAFWTEKQKTDAVGFAKEALTGLDTLDQVLSAPTVDPMAAQAAAKQVQGACASCHIASRDGDGKATPYSIKPGVF